MHVTDLAPAGQPRPGTPWGPSRALRGLVGLFLAGVSGGCTLAHVPVVPPPAVAATPAPVRIDFPDGRRSGAPEVVRRDPVLPAPSPAADRDEILHSPTLANPAFQARVDHWTNNWQRGEGPRLPLYLERMAHYQDLVDAVLESHGLPRSLRYLPFLESGYSPRAVSRVSAVGLWQFMAPTAAELGLSVSALLDERRDPVASTDAAARYLTQLHGRFGSWFLALAAYNGGPTRVAGLLARHAPGAQASDDLYLVIGPYLPSETREFVARFVAGARIAMDPEAYGLAAPQGVEPFAWDDAFIDDAASIDVLAYAADTSEELMRSLNPHLLRGMTPRGVATTVRLPPGTAGLFQERWAAIPPGERLTVTEHRVAAGETLSHIARAYGIRLAELQAANPGVDARRLQIGQALVVPIAPPMRTAEAAGGSR